MIQHNTTSGCLYAECDISSRDFSVSRLFSIFWEYRALSRKFGSRKKVSISVSKIFGLEKKSRSRKFWSRKKSRYRPQWIFLVSSLSGPSLKSSPISTQSYSSEFYNGTSENIMNMIKWDKVELTSKKGVKRKGLESKKGLSASFNAHDWCSHACLQLLVLFSVDIAIHNHLPLIMLPYSSFGLKGRVIRVTIIFNSKISFSKDAFKQTEKTCMMTWQ